jgi:hypothetical protein
MRRPNPLNLICLLVLLHGQTGCARPEDPAAAATGDKSFYLTQSGTGDGRSLSAPASVAWFNSPGNWGEGATRIGPGDTVHLVGTITTPLTVQAGGTAGHAITLLFDRGASMQAPVWPVTGAINLNGKNHITIDGGATGTIGGPRGHPAGANGFIENTANGTTRAHRSRSIFIYAPDSSFLTVQNLGLYNLYVRTGMTDEAPGAGAIRDWSAIATFGSSGFARSNVLVRNCLIHDAYSGFYAAYTAGCSNFEYASCTAYNCNWGGNCGDSDRAAALSHLSVHDNYFYDFGNWDDRRDYFHHNGYFAWAVSGGTLTTVRMYNNVVGPNFSNGGPPASGGLFIEGLVADVAIYNNLFKENPRDHPADGLVFIAPFPNISATYAVLNNTFIGGGAGVAINFGPTKSPVSAQTIVIKNNLILGAGTAIALYKMNANVTAAIDHNLGSHLLSGLGYAFSATNASSFKTFKRWQGLGYDIHGSDRDPGLGADYVPRGASPAVGAGADLSDLGYFTTDIAGAIRPRGAPWDIGAYEWEGRDK